MLDHRQQSGTKESRFIFYLLIEHNFILFQWQSVQFHERGEGHKAQVQRRLNELTKKGEIEYRLQQEVNTDMKRMEEAALRAYHKDLTSNPDLTARVSNS